MSNKTKKRILTLSLVVALLAIVMIGSSLAWFTAEEEVTNVFTVGSVKIQQNEDQYVRDEDTGERTEETEPFEDGKVLLPVVDEENPYNDVSYQDKIVTVTATGNNGAYVRTHIAVPMSLVGYLDLDLEENTPWKFDYSTTDVDVEGMKYVVYTYLYTQELAPGKTTETLLKGVYLYAPVDVKQAQDGSWQFCKWNAETGAFDFSGFVVEDAEGNAQTVDVLVATQAVQSAGFPDAKTALDEAFNGETVPAFSGT